MQAELCRDSADFWASWRIAKSGGWRELLRRTPGPHLYMTDQRGTFYDSCTAAPAPAISVEDSGPLRVSVCVRGFHSSDDGRRFCPYILRVHFFAGRSDLRLHHTFIFDQDPERTELSAVGMRFPLDVGGEPVAAFGGAAAQGKALTDGFGQILHLSDLEYRVEKEGLPPITGENARGWAALRGEAGGVLASLRHPWQEHPKGIAVSPDQIEIEVWPPDCGRPLQFSTPYKEEAIFFNGTRDEAEFRRLVQARPTAPLNLKSLRAESLEDLLWVEEMVDRYAPGRPASYNDTGTSNGFGAAKTTEFWLRASANPVADEEAEAWADAVQGPLIAVVDPAHACATGAMRLMASRDERRFPEAERALDGLFDRVVAEPRRVLRTYGMMDYGDLMCSHSGSPGPMWEYAKGRPDVAQRMRHCARSYNNEANDQLNALWGFFVHSGCRDHYLAAEAYGRHMADVDIIHAGDSAGVIHYHNAHHWTGVPSPSHTPIAGLMLQYYLTGDRRILEVCRQCADWALARQEPCGIFSNRTGVLVREYTTPLANLLEFYQATWEERYGELARRSLTWLLRAMPEPGCFPVSIYTAGDRGDEAVVEQHGWSLRQAGGMAPQLLYDAVQLFGKDSPIFREALIGLARRYLFGPESPEYEAIEIGPKRLKRLDPYFNAPIIAYAWELTRDPVYAAFCRYYLREHFARVVRRFLFTYVCWGSIIPPMMEAVRRAEAQHGNHVLDCAEEDWIRRAVAAAEASLPAAPPGRPPARSIGVITGYD